MTSIETITSSIRATMKSVTQHIDYPNVPGLYGFQLAKDAILGNLGFGGQIVYVGKAEDSLKKRDLNTHFKDNCTGSSTLRRSIGAILKDEFKAIAFSRNGTLDRPNIDNYKFDTEAERKLSKWMNDNLLVGYWEYDCAIEEKLLHEIEVQLILALKPTLDLDNETKSFNPHAAELTSLRQICKDEATKKVLKKVEYY